MHVMQIEPFSSILRGDTQKALESMAARVREQAASAGIECIVQGANVDTTQKISVQTNVGPQFSSLLEPFYHCSTNQEWANFNYLSSSLIPVYAGDSVLVEGQQQDNLEHNYLLNLDHANKGVTISTQSSTKGKAIVPNVGSKKGKKQVAVNKGKTKVIATGHKLSPKKMWMKRGGITIDEGQQGGKKPRMTFNDDNMQTEDDLFLGEDLYTGQTTWGPFEANTTEKAESGVHQLRQAK